MAPQQTQPNPTWSLPESQPGVRDAVLVECGGDHPYWWVLCPATATLVIAPSSRAEEDTIDLTGCSHGDSCDWDEVHAAAAEIIADRIRKTS